ncbi:hypothetical protein [Mucilaginibacter limnophilus]|uniref:hypothetical protein n=1 Tax=Mucilaginibacter limnophilus TaxID=1932778 RepID=UPI0013E34A46|nr:hypothetical protein [Mucilaginibacter limnophilus]
MRNLVLLVLIILTIGVFSLNANSRLTPADNTPEAPVQKLSGFKKDISTAD